MGDCLVTVNIPSGELRKTMKVSFDKRASSHLHRYTLLAERELYYYLLNHDEFPAVAPRAEQLVEQTLALVDEKLTDNGNLPPHLQAFDYSPTALSERMDLLRHSLSAGSPPATPLSRAQLDDVLKQYAPAALLDGCWLQNVSIASSNHTEIVTRLFHIYTEKIGDGDTAKHYGNLYRELLQSARIYLPEVNSRLFTLQPEVRDSAFVSPVFQLALSLFPRLYMPELLGYTLGHLVVSQDRLLYLLSDEIQRQGLDQRYCQRYIPEQCERAQDLCREAVILYLDQYPEAEEKQAQWRRIWRGVVAHGDVTITWQRDLQTVLRHHDTLTPHQKMLAMVRAKAPHARNMHRNRKLGGQSINDWFAHEPFDAEGFLQALANSPYVNVLQPEKSALLTRSIDFGGPMFRIFTEAEQAIMAEWIASLATSSLPESTATAVDAKAPVATSIMPCEPDHPRDPDLATYAKCNKRELYYYFVNADLFPNVLPTAREVATQYFRRARAAMEKRRLPELLHFFPYSHTAFQTRITQIYTTETQAYQPFVPPSTVPREIMVWYVQQYAPFPMVDGSWVQHIAKAGMSHTEISARLFRIYSDEVGNASTLLNHPNVYRRLLEKEGIHMPPTDTLEFAMQPALRDFAFDLPLLTLSVSMFPKAFLPEIIGVNLAIELSGLGKGYMQIIDELKYWQIDPYFFTLHLTIDNIASGHTAVAMETVHLYLDQILATQGQQVMQGEWKRIWIGFLSFRRAMTKFDTTLEREAPLRFMLPLIKQTLRRRKALKQKRRVTAQAVA